MRAVTPPSMAGEGGWQEQGRGAGTLPVLGRCGRPATVPGKGAGARSVGAGSGRALPGVSTAVLIYTPEGAHSIRNTQPSPAPLPTPPQSGAGGPRRALAASIRPVAQRASFCRTLPHAEFAEEGKHGPNHPRFRRRAGSEPAGEGARIPAEAETQPGARYAAPR